MNQDLNVLVVEDDAVIAQLIKQDLSDAGHHVLAIAHKYQEALSCLDNFQPNLVLLDINLGQGNEGIQLGKVINAKFSIPFIYLTAHSDPKTLQLAKQTQPCGYVVKPYRSNDLKSAITIGLFNYEKRNLGQELSINTINSKAVTPLSEREFDIVLDITKGLTNAQIAEKQFLSLNTIKWHVQNIYSKIQVKNRTSLVKKVFEV